MTSHAALPAPELLERLAHPGDDEVASLDAWWRANNYLTVGQIYLMANPLLREPLTADAHQAAAARALGHEPGPVVRLRARVAADPRRPARRCIYLAGPGHGGPALVAAGYLEGAYTETYPAITQDRGGHPPAVPAVLRPRRHPQPRVGDDARVDPRGRRARLRPGARLRRGDGQPRPASRSPIVGDGEAETGPLEGSWKGISFLNPERDGAVLPILHLNGAKIAGPTVLGRKDPARGPLRCSRVTATR